MARAHRAEFAASLGPILRHLRVGTAIQVRSDRKHLQIQQGDLVRARPSGHMRAFSGRAYLRQRHSERRESRRFALMRAVRMALGVAICVAGAISCGGGGRRRRRGRRHQSRRTANRAEQCGQRDRRSKAHRTTASIRCLYRSRCACPAAPDCQTIDHIQVDTGSYGLRILAPVLTLTLAGADLGERPVAGGMHAVRGRLQLGAD